MSNNDDEWESNPIEFLEKKKIKKKTGGGFSKGTKENSYWSWFMKKGRAMFHEQTGEDYENGRPEHYKIITALWQNAPENPGADIASPPVELLTRSMAMMRGRRSPSSPPALTEAEKREKKRNKAGMHGGSWKPRIKFLRRTDRELDLVRNRKKKDFSMKLSIAVSVHRAGKGAANEVLRGLRMFLFVVTEFTSNSSGDRVCPAEVTLLSFSVKQGIQHMMSRIVKFDEVAAYGIGNNHNNHRHDGEIAERVQEMFELTGIPAERLNEPSPKEARTLQNVQSELLSFLTKSGDNKTPIMLLSENYNSAAGLLFMMYPDLWGSLDLRICFMDDLLSVLMHVAEGQAHPIQALDQPPSFPLCTFHARLMHDQPAHRRCTQRVAGAAIQQLFMNMRDARVLDMHRTFSEDLHLMMDNGNGWALDGPQIDWGQPRQPQPEAPIGYLSSASSGTEDSDDDFYAAAASVPAPAAPAAATARNGVGYRNDTSPPEEQYRSPNGSGVGANGGGGGWSRERRYSRSPERQSEPRRGEEWQGGGAASRGRGGAFNPAPRSSNGGFNGFGDFNNGGSRSEVDRAGGREMNRDFGESQPRRGFGALPAPQFGEVERGRSEEAMPAQRRRAASPTQSEMGGGGRREEEDRDRRRELPGRAQFSRPTMARDGPLRSIGNQNHHQPQQQAREPPAGSRGVFRARPIVESEHDRVTYDDRRPGGDCGPLPEGRALRDRRFVGGLGTLPHSSRLPMDSHVMEEARRREQRREREEREQEAAREQARSGAWQTTRGPRGPASPPPLSGKQRETREARLNPNFADSGAPRSSQQQLQQQALPLRVGLSNDRSPPPRPPVEETAEERAAKREDAEIADTIEFLDVGSFDRFVASLRRQLAADRSRSGRGGPRDSDFFRPDLWPASRESDGNRLDKATFDEKFELQCAAESRRKAAPQ